MAWTTHADLAAGAVLALTGDVFDGNTLPLTGSEALYMTDVAALAPPASAGRSGGWSSPTRGTAPNCWNRALRARGRPARGFVRREPALVLRAGGPTPRLLDGPTTTLAAFLDGR